MPQSLRRIRLLPVALVLALLQGCGWQLRGTTNLPASVTPLYVVGEARYSRLHMELTRALRSNGVPVTENRSEAASLLRILKHKADSRVLSVVPSTGKVAEIELHQEIQFSLSDASGEELVAPQRIRLLRAYLNTETETLGKLHEADVLTKEMRQELAQMIVRRLQTNLR